MIDERELNQAIDECIKNPHNAQVCQQLASFLIIRSFLFPKDEEQTTQYSYADESVLPAYDDFVNAKWLFQKGEGSKDKLIKTLNALLRQIQDLIKNLYSNSNTPEERAAITEVIEKMNIGNL